MSNTIALAFLTRPTGFVPVGMMCSAHPFAAYAYAWQRAQVLAALAKRPRFDPSWN